MKTNGYFHLGFKHTLGILYSFMRWPVRCGRDSGDTVDYFHRFYKLEEWPSIQGDKGKSPGGQEAEDRSEEDQVSMGTGLVSLNNVAGCGL
jgi:hypothetical protein